METAQRRPPSTPRNRRRQDRIANDQPVESRGGSNAASKIRRQQSKHRVNTSAGPTGWTAQFSSL